MKEVHLDGSAGEGGGQILRTALSLSAVTGTPFVIERIRARRQRPGLLRQHLTAVRAAAEICNAQVDGERLGSARLAFAPGAIRGGDYRFSIGTAGSTGLVCQTVLPILLSADRASTVVFEGGTHNPLAPSYDFLTGVFLPLLARLGLEYESELSRYGFYPAGGGSFRLAVAPCRKLGRLELYEVSHEATIHATALFARLARRIAERELAVVREALGVEGVIREVRSLGPGNVLELSIDRGTVELVTSFGERGKPAERVAAEAVAEARELLDSGVPVGRHLADQLLLPMALGSGGVFMTLSPSEHLRTNIDVVRRFIERTITVHEEDGRFRVEVSAG
jgi:RNA 3'-terminal phosphate cyclase (ATP)